MCMWIERSQFWFEILLTAKWNAFLSLAEWWKDWPARRGDVNWKPGRQQIIMFKNNVTLIHPHTHLLFKIL